MESQDVQCRRSQWKKVQKKRRETVAGLKDSDEHAYKRTRKSSPEGFFHPEEDVFHPFGLCKPCCWIDKGCKKGDDCNWCHLCSQKVLKERKKGKITEAKRKGILLKTITEQISKKRAELWKQFCEQNPTLGDRFDGRDSSNSARSRERFFHPEEDVFHPLELCKPCAWFHKSGCEFGNECTSWHLCPAQAIPRRQKETCAEADFRNVKQKVIMAEFFQKRVLTLKSFCDANPTLIMGVFFKNQKKRRYVLGSDISAVFLELDGYGIPLRRSANFQRRGVSRLVIEAGRNCSCNFEGVSCPKFKNSASHEWKAQPKFSWADESED